VNVKLDSRGDITVLFPKNADGDGLTKLQTFGKSDLRSTPAIPMLEGSLLKLGKRSSSPFGICAGAPASLFGGALFAIFKDLPSLSSPVAWYGKTHVEILCTDLAR
jgi:hypothetical protein